MCNTSWAPKRGIPNVKNRKNKIFILRVVMVYVLKYYKGIIIAHEYKYILKHEKCVCDSIFQSIVLIYKEQEI